MYALIEYKGKQYKAEKGAVLTVDKLSEEKGATHRCIRGRADTGINEYGHFGVVDDQAQVPGIDNAHARADQRGQRHD